MSGDPTSGRHRGGHLHGGRQWMVRAVQVIAALVSVATFVAFGYGWYNYHSLTSHRHSIQIAGLGAPPPTRAVSGAPVVTHRDGAAENILIVGVDSRAGLTDAQKRYYKVGLGDQSTSTDTIIVVHVPADGSRATLLSIPRDTYVDIRGFSANKINAAYADGYYDSGASTPKAQQSAGASLLVDTVKHLTGLSLDHYVQVGFGGFVDIVKALHSVPITLCKSVDDTYAHNRALNISGYSGFKMTAGPHNLDPQQALEFVRQRHNIPGPVSDDLGREARQRYFLRAAFSEIESAGTLLNPFKLKRLIDAVDGAFTFEQGNFGFQQFAEQMSDLTAGNIAGKSIPTTGSRVFPAPVGAALIVDVPAVKRFAHNLFYPPPRDVRSSAATRPPAASSGAPSASTVRPTRTCVY